MPTCSWWGDSSPQRSPPSLCSACSCPKPPCRPPWQDLLVGPLTYGTLSWTLPQVPFLNHMAFTFPTVVGVMAAFTLAQPLTTPVQYAAQSDIDLTPSKGSRGGGVVVVFTTVLLYVVFW